VLSPVTVRLHLAACGLLLLPAATAVAQPIATPPPAPYAIVLVADGSGGLPGPSAELRRLAACSCMLMKVEPVQWSYGTGWIMLDLYVHSHHLSQGQVLAKQIMAYRQNCPTVRICLVGHSSGTAVILAAAECLPPGTVDRIVLLAPSVSKTYDLRAALNSSREGIDCFFSHRDMVSLSMTVWPTADLRYFTGAAGFFGFQSGGGCCNGLCGPLRQHENVTHGHFSCNQTAFLRDHVMPMLEMCSVNAAPVVSPEARAAILATSYSSPAAREAYMASLLPPLEDFVYTPPPQQGPRPAAGRSGIPPISDSLRLP
jgi:hypothetical protein